MSPTLKQNQELSNIFFITLKIVKGIHIFKSKNYFNIILNSLDYCQKNKGLVIWAYTIIINHLHLVFTIKPEFQAYKTIADFKKFTARKILQELKKNQESEIIKLLKYIAIKDKDREHKIWKQGCFPKAILTPEFLGQKINYVDNNAVKHNIVKDIEDYPYTSYHNHYCNHLALLKISPVEFY